MRGNECRVEQLFDPNWLLSLMQRPTSQPHSLIKIMLVPNAARRIPCSIAGGIAGELRSSLAFNDEVGRKETADGCNFPVCREYHRAA